MVCERALIRGDSIGAVLSGLFVAYAWGLGNQSCIMTGLYSSN
jgi:hypothetical protein